MKVSPESTKKDPTGLRIGSVYFRNESGIKRQLYQLPNNHQVS